MSEVAISAEPRSEFGKGAARRIRRAHQVPAVLYGHGEDPRHISLPGHELMLALKTPNVLLNITLNGSKELALPRDVQRDPVRGFLEHVDLLIVKKGEKVKVAVPVHVVGQAGPDTVVLQDLNELEVLAEATHIPTHFDANVDGLRAGSHVVAKEIVLPAGVELANDPDQLVVAVTAAITEEALEAELAEAEAEAGIVREESDEEIAAAEAEAAADGEAGDAPAEAAAE